MAIHGIIVEDVVHWVMDTIADSYGSVPIPIMLDGESRCHIICSSGVYNT